MSLKLLRSSGFRTTLIVLALLASGFALMVSNQYAAAASGRNNLIVGLQQDMLNLNINDPATNSVWKAYQITNWNFETLFTFDPAYQVYPDLADGSKTCPAGSPTGSVGGPGYCIDPSGLNITVYLHNNVTFTDGKPFTAADVLFTYQVEIPWSVVSTSVTNAIWWEAPIAPLWNSTAYNSMLGSYFPGNYTCSAGPKGGPCMSHVGVFAIDPFTVRFQLTPHTIGSTIHNAGYALIFYDTLNAAIVPQHVWDRKGLSMQATAQINYSDPNLGLITDTWDTAINFGYGSATQTDASIGTGPFMLQTWTINSGSREVTYPKYWGIGQSHTWNGQVFPFWPKTIRELDFRIFGSLDVVELALQQGTIDTLAWSLTPGFVNVVSSNPAITVQTVTESGYYYLAFNMRKSPWNNLGLRTAISQAIDKNYIVNTLLGGFGTPGTVPISIANPNYVNTAVNFPSFNLAGAVQSLQSGGFTFNSGTGFWQDANGTPVSATILTPPKDYDPVRADAGIMISSNLKSIGLNIGSAPTSFNTIVAKAFTRPVDFDIYILGWSLTLFPEAYLCSFFCTNQDVNINPAGSNSAGLHDSLLDSMITQATYTSDTNARYNVVKAIEAEIDKEIPWNVLYDRKTVVAWRNDAWSGWVLYPNGFNQLQPYSVESLVPPSVPTAQAPAGALTVAVSIPDQVYFREHVPVNVYVSQNNAPVANAAVSVNISFGVGSFSVDLTGQTNAQGKFGTTWTVPLIQGSGIVTATATSGTVTGSTSNVIESTIGPPMPMAQIALSTATPVITPTGHATVVATVTGPDGTAIAGMHINIDSKVTVGNITPWYADTNSAGQATFTYSPPGATSLANANFEDLVRARISVASTIAPETQEAQMYIVTQNNAAPSWDIVSLDTTTPPAFTVDKVTSAQNYTVDVTSFQGLPVAGANVEAVLSDTGNFTVTPATFTTTASGKATFMVSANVAALTAGTTTTLSVMFDVKNAVNTTSDQILVFLWDGVATTHGYGGYMTFTERAVPYSPFTGANLINNNVTLHLFNELGAPASGVPALFKLSDGPYGLPAQFPFLLTCGATCPAYPVNGSLDLEFFGQGSLGGSLQSSVGQGWNYGVENLVDDFEAVGYAPNFVTGTYLDACDPTGVVNAKYGVGPAPDKQWGGSYIINVTSTTDYLGTYSLGFFTEQYPIDALVELQAFVGASGGTPQVIANPCAGSGSINNFANSISSGFVTQRAPIFALSSVTASQPIATSQSRVVKFVAQFKDLNGPVNSADVLMLQGAGSAARNVLGTYGGPQVTDANGYLNYTRTICSSNGACSASSSPPSLSQGLTFAYTPSDPRYAFSAHDQLYSYALGDFWIGPTFEYLNAKLPMSFTFGYLYLPTTTAFLTVSESSDLLSLGTQTSVSVTVSSSLTGAPIAGATVYMANLQGTTNATGVVTLNVTANSYGAIQGPIVATTSYGGIARGWYAFIASPPVLSFSGLQATVGQAGSPTTITVSGQNTLPVSGNATVWLSVGGTPVAGQVLQYAASETKTITFTYVFATAGQYTVTVGSQSVSVNVPAVPPVDNTVLYALAIGLLVVGLVAGVVVGMMMSRRRKTPPTSIPSEEAPPEGEAPKSAEEELGPEDKL